MLDEDTYFMKLAVTTSERANCRGRKVGAVLVREERIISTGYDGTPMNLENCVDGGCARCANREAYPSGTFYDICICVHAESNAIASAAGQPVGAPKADCRRDYNLALWTSYGSDRHSPSDRCMSQK